MDRHVENFDRVPSRPMTAACVQTAATTLATVCFTSTANRFFASDRAGTLIVDQLVSTDKPDSFDGNHETGAARSGRLP